MDNHQPINISSAAIIKIILILAGFVFLFLIREIILMIFVAIIIAASLSEPVNFLQKKRIPRWLAVLLIYLILLVIFAGIIYLIIPPFSEQIKIISQNFPAYIEKINLNFEKLQKVSNIGEVQQLLENLGQRLSQAAGGIFPAISNIFGGIISAFVILVISIYLTAQERGIKEFILNITPIAHQIYVTNLIDRIQKKIGGWMRGQIILMLLIGLLTFFGLKLLGVKYALTLALLSGVLEIVPYIGPIIAAFFAVGLSFLQSPILGLWVLILYIIIQQLENQLIVPQVMKRTVGLNPLIIILVMLIGVKLAGFLGLILAVPLAAAVAEILKDFVHRTPVR